MKIAVKITLILCEYAVLLLLFIPYLFLVCCASIVYNVIDLISDVQDKKHIKNKQKRAIRQIDRDNKRRHTIANMVFGYWKERLFS